MAVRTMVTTQAAGHAGRSVLGFLAASVFAAAPALAQSFPADDAWRAFPCGNAPMRDAVADHPGAPRERDLVGTAPAPAGLRAADADFLYLRMRLGDDPRQGPNLRPSTSWGFAFSTDGQDNGYEALLAVDGSARTVAVFRNSSVTVPDSPEDPADSPAVASYPFASHGRVVAAGSALGTVTDYFLDLAVPWRDLAMVGLTPDQTTVTWAASSSSPDRLNLNLACHDAGGAAGVPRLAGSGSSAERTAPAGGGGGTGGTGGARHGRRGRHPARGRAGLRLRRASPWTPASTHGGGGAAAGRAGFLQGPGNGTQALNQHRRGWKLDTNISSLARSRSMAVRPPPASSR